MDKHCEFHKAHEGRIERNEKDIQDLFRMMEKQQWIIACIVGGITLLAKAFDHFVPLVK